MDEFPGLLARDFGIRPQGKAAPMAAAKGAGSFHGTSNLNIGIGRGGDSRSSSFSSSRSKSGWNSNSVDGSFLDGRDGLLGSTATRKTQGNGDGGYGDVFGGTPNHDNHRTETRGAAAFDCDSIFQSKDSSAVFDKPKNDDDSDIFHRLPGMKGSSSATVNNDDVFSGVGSPSKQNAALDDLLGNFRRKDSDSKSSSGRRSEEVVKGSSDFDDLIPGFGGTRPPKNRATSEMNHPWQSTVPPTNSTASMMDVPFVVLESTPSSTYPPSDIFNDALEQMSKPSNSGNKIFGCSTRNGMVSDDMDPLDSLGKSVPMFSSEMNNKGREKIPSMDESTVKMSKDTSQMKVPVDNYLESHQTFFDIPSVSSHSNKAAGHAGSRTNFVNADSNETSSWVDMTPTSEKNWRDVDDVWLMVSEISLLTQPTSSPPPSQSPPKPTQVLKGDKGSFAPVSTKKVNDGLTFPHSTKNFHSPGTVTDSAKSSGVSSIDELEDFAMGRSRSNGDEHADSLSSEEGIETNSAAAAAMKEAMDRAEVKFKHAREVREREVARAARSREAVQQDAQERELREKQQRSDHEGEREEKEREQRRIERESERAREIEMEKKGRQAVERATREARNRAAAEAHLKAERAQSDARERAAVQRVQAEARERAAMEAKERAERAAAEAREGEAREQAAVARAEAEVRRRAERTERAGKALAEKNQRDLQTQRDQAERSRIAEKLDIEIKRWAAGKERNLLSLLSTLQYVLWPECGWQPVSLADLMTPASVKKVYRKANLCIHPDKVQQKGANLQQKYIAEKVFDLLQEAWTIFNKDPKKECQSYSILTSLLVLFFLWSNNA